MGLISDKAFAYFVLSFISLTASGLGMTLNVKKSGVKHHEKGVLFLGVKIYGNYGFKVVFTKDKSQRVGDVILKFGVPLERLFQRFTDRGFFQLVKNRKTSKFVGRRVDKWLFLNNPYDIIIRFNSVIRGVAYYYTCSTYRSVLDRFWHTMRRSAALTVAHHFKKRNAKWTFNKFGSNIKVNNPSNGKIVELLMPTVGRHAFKDGQLNHMLVKTEGAPLPVTLNAVCSASELNCAVPNCTRNAEH